MEGSFNLRLVLRAGVSPSEDREKVVTAMKNVFGDCDYSIEERDDEVAFRSTESACLTRIHDQLRDRHVRDAARRLLVKSREGERASLLFNRQAAVAGVVSVVSSAEESPLGPIALHIECNRMDDLMDWLTVVRPTEPQARAHREPPESY